MKSKAELHGCYPTRKQATWAGRCKNRLFPETALNAFRLVIPAGATIIDVGATIGHIARALIAAGYDVQAVDGSDGVEQLSGGLVKQLDLVSDDCGHLFGKFRWCLFLDVGEHIPAEHESSVIDKVARMSTEGLIVSWNTWDDSNPDHINLRSEDYVVNLFELRGWTLDEEGTKGYRLLIGKRAARRRTPLVFRRRR